MGVDKSLINPQERLVPASTNPGGLPPIFGPDVGHGGRLGIPVGHVQDRPAQLSFLQDNEYIYIYKYKYIHSEEQYISSISKQVSNSEHLKKCNLQSEKPLTEKLPNVKTCPSMRRTAVWLLPAVTWTLGPGRACTRVGEPLAGGSI